MTQRDDFENRLGQGLKRWATAGEPTLDLEAYVLARTGSAEQADPTSIEPRALPTSHRRWTRWLGTVAAAAAVILTLGVTFPSWAGAAAGWPILGPVVKEIIMKDAGLQWAYEAGLLQQPLAEVKEGDVSVKILAVLADNYRTTVIYQANGLEEPDRRPMRVEDSSLFGLLARPAGGHDHSLVSVTRVEGQEQVWASFGQPVWTPLGVFGTVSTVPLGPESGTVGLVVRVGGKEFPLNLQVSRAEASRYSREVVVEQAHRIADVTVTVHSVIYTPAETVIRYSVEKPQYNGGWGHGNSEWLSHLLIGTRRVNGTNIRHTQDGFIYQTFPAAESKGTRLVIPIEVVGREVNLVWKLERDAEQAVADTTIRLTQVDRRGDKLAIEWRYVRQGQFMAFDSLELLDAAGNSVPARAEAASWSDSPEAVKSLLLTVPEGFEPVAIRAKQIAVRVDGPWVFELPTR